MFTDERTSVECPGCGAVAEAGKERCPICAKQVGEGYLPLDVIRSSYRLQGVAGEISESGAELFPPSNNNTSAQIAWASFVFSLVPFLGILFVPVTLFAAVSGYLAQVRRPETGGGKMAVCAFVLSFAVIGVQYILWWLLYIVPELGRGI